MGWQFRKRVRLLPGVSLNVSNSGLSTSVGGDGVTVNYGRRGLRTTLNVKGSGLRYVHMPKPSKLPTLPAGPRRRGAGWYVMLALWAFLVLWLIAHAPR